MNSGSINAMIGQAYIYIEPIFARLISVKKRLIEIVAATILSSSAWAHKVKHLRLARSKIAIVTKKLAQSTITWIKLNSIAAFKVSQSTAKHRITPAAKIMRNALIRQLGILTFELT
ncbi:hypothetical protein H5201_08810 [Pseudoalteromonas sp. SG43-6]|uniref:hypothetical protein n=1 Tax=Pseudoalteromonas sp. SG43-6 TaxID=2760967 RepID=UPI0015FF5EEC|nr:hypothetical protein [Pseudoalteromonas sp. SG43-6]MBB1434409.1 hypothetical protein [Pseudoalteromonas sp. SG43-6]